MSAREPDKLGGPVGLCRMHKGLTFGRQLDSIESEDSYIRRVYYIGVAYSTLVVARVIPVATVMPVHVTG
jgi:hypothetical protein